MSDSFDNECSTDADLETTATQTEEAESVPPSSLEPLTPSLLVDDRYRVERELGRGGMGVVYLAQDAWLGRPVALKMISPSRLNDAAATKRFHNEARVLASVRSQHVVQVYAFGMHHEAYYFAMEHVNGRSLRAILGDHAAHRALVPLLRVLTIVSRIAEGLGAVHAAGIVHRDVKPSNIVIEHDTGRPVLVDFGLAAHPSASGSLQPAGTLNYMAPEQLFGARRSSPQSDLYGLGCIAFELLTGRLPFEGRGKGDILRLIADPVPLLSSMRPEIALLDEVLARALAKEPSSRYESCSAFSAALRVGVEQAQSNGAPAMASRPPPPLRGDGMIHALVVDDDPISRKFAAAAVQYVFSLRVVVASAGSGLEAIEHAERELPDLVILDYDMPGLDGVDTLSRLRGLPGGDRIRVVVVSGRIAEAERWRFSVLGVRDFVPKPVDFRHLAEYVAGVARRLREG